MNYLCGSFTNSRLKSFHDLGLSDNLLDVLKSMEFTTPTPIQLEAIPILMGENPTDFIGLAQTGTGKTAAFGLPLLDLIDIDLQATQALIMAPTRELGQQTAQQLVQFAKNQPKLRVEVVYGGASIVNQLRALKRKPHILVATPGRLLDLIERRAVHLDTVDYVVLDEADEMLNMGFKEDIDRILSYTPDTRVTWLFSATMPSEIRRIIHKYMDTPKEVSVNTEQKSNTDITHQYVVTKSINKVPALRRFLDQQPDLRGILFCRTKRETQQIADDLGAKGYQVEALHGDLSQAQRDAVMRRFKTRDMQLLCATDVAARGIDVNNLTHVLHHLLPDQIESYTHRSGRTGRAGKKGISLAFINAREVRRISELEKRIGIKFERVEVPSMEELMNKRMDHWADQLLNMPVSHKSEDILAQLTDRFAEISKEDLLKRLISGELDQLSGNGSESADLNERGGSRVVDNGREGFHRYFINVGSIDGFTRMDLADMLSEVSGVKKKHLGQIDIKKNCAFFDLEASESKGFSDRFEGLELDERAIRVNRDNDGPAKGRKGGRGGYGKPQFKGKSGYKGGFHKGKSGGQKPFRGKR